MTLTYGVSFQSSWWARFHGSVKTNAEWVWHSSKIGELCFGFDIDAKTFRRLQAIFLNHWCFVVSKFSPYSKSPFRVRDWEEGVAGRNHSMEEWKRIEFPWQGDSDLPSRQINDLLPIWPYLVFAYVRLRCPHSLVIYSQSQVIHSLVRNRKCIDFHHF